ncbi:MAG: hypothetical protein MUF49_28005 [Oculatellaceae cyanobacterium Prado106]|jgi:hypothetical protein|nr:hypothetical protein [Oculatellaceae cyanobacterium Prado106]
MDMRTMGINIKMGLKVGVAIALPIVCMGFMGNVALAQEAPADDESITIPEAFDRAFYRFDENFYRNRQVPRSLTWFLGPFPENEIAGDGRMVNRLYREVFTQQTTEDPTIRTADLPNPFSYSLSTDSIVPPEEPIPSPAFTSFSAPPPMPSSGGSRFNSNFPVPALW